MITIKTGKRYVFIPIKPHVQRLLEVFIEASDLHYEVLKTQAARLMYSNKKRKQLFEDIIYNKERAHEKLLVLIDDVS